MPCPNAGAFMAGDSKGKGQSSGRRLGAAGVPERARRRGAPLCERGGGRGKGRSHAVRGGGAAGPRSPGEAPGRPGGGPGLRGGAAGGGAGARLV